MSSSYQALRPARLQRDARGRPVSPEYGDIYYAGAQPLAQSREVFLRGTGLPQRWQGRHHFTVLETGFGLGLNFLATWQAWRDDPRRSERLHMVSIEAHPLERNELALALAVLQGPERRLAQALLREWPPLVPGLHRLEFEAGAVTLTLALGSVDRMARQLELGFDAGFLDGFSPRVNPQMWTPRVFGQLARLANRDAHLASWCSAGQVRRDLQDAGFLVSRESGFGLKRHRMTARLRPGMGRAPASARPGAVIVVGASFAGAATAHALACRGHSVTVLDPALAQGISSAHRDHRGAVLGSGVSRDHDVRTRIGQAGLELGRRRWSRLAPEARPWPCGLFEPVTPAARERWQASLAHLAYPHTWLRWLDEVQAAARTGVAGIGPGLWHPRAQLVRPVPFLEGLLAGDAIRCRAAAVAGLHRAGDGEWQAVCDRGRVLARAPRVVLANGWQAGALLGTIAGLELPLRVTGMRRMAGQLSYFAPLEQMALRCIVAGDGLCMPDGDAGLLGGSTYVHDATLSIMTAQGHDEIRRKVGSLLNVDASRLGLRRALPQGWAGWRAAAHDRLPIMGMVAQAPGLWLACAMGSRGLAWSALGAELLAARLSHEPLPLERELVRKLAP
ncbi:MAG: tRNA (5-methylaminomethyl-2-thiouridine)(34)-methyltransferase MnmD [Castellaniella sp.]